MNGSHHRPRGEVGGMRQTLSNSNQNAIPHDLGVAGSWIVGDTTWPGLGTVAGCIASRLVAEDVLKRANRYHSESARSSKSAGQRSQPCLLQRALCR